MNFEKLIQNKNILKNHSKPELDFIVNSYLKGYLSDNEMTLWLKSIYKNGMSIRETADYTETIINSGDKLNFGSLDGYIIDKHSTGGVGDKISLILGPVLAACGCYVPMIVGRHLGHTGGTLDKLESIPGYNGNLSNNEFKNNVKNVGISIIGQTDSICPADKKIYSLRHKTDTVSSYPLICGSIMGKKIAEGIQGLVLDIKIGNGAFMKDIESGKKLSDLLKLIGGYFNVNVESVFTDMNQPIGRFSGLRCEINESIDILKGFKCAETMNIVYDLGTTALKISGFTNTKKMIDNVINDGSAYEIFEKMIYVHGGNLNSVNYKFDNVVKVRSSSHGVLLYTNTTLIGNLINKLTVTNKKIDTNAGIQFFKKNNDKIYKNEVICEIFSNNILSNELAKKQILNSFKIS